MDCIYNEGERYSINITLNTVISIEIDRLVMKDKNNVLAFTLLNHSKREISSPIITKLYFIKSEIDEILNKSFKSLKDGNSIQESINIEVDIEILPEYYLRDVVLLQMFDDFSQKDFQYTTVKLLKYAKEGRMLLVTIKDEPVGFAVLNRERTKILKKYIDTDYRSLGIEEIFELERR